MGGHEVAARFVERDEQRGRVGASGDRGENSARWELVHGGAGWTQTTNNAIMSRALYHLSYGTAVRDASERPGRAPSACSSFSGAWRWRLAFSCSWPQTRVGWGAWNQDGCGAWIRTKDLRVMSPTSCRCSTPRFDYTRGLSRPYRAVFPTRFAQNVCVDRAREARFAQNVRIATG